MALYRRCSLIGLLTVIVIILSGCGPQRDVQYQKYGSAGLKKIGIVLGSPGKVNPGSNASLTTGLQKAASDIDIEYKMLAPKDLVNDREALSYLAENNYDMVVAVGSGMAEDLNAIASRYPDIKFIMFDGEVDEPNVTSVKILEDDGAFLAGVEAALLTKTNLVGYIGDPITTVTTIENSFVKGVQYVNSTEGKQVRVNVSYTGVTDKAAKVAELAKGLADNFYLSGVDVIFSANNNVNRGVANSAAEMKKIAICNDIQLMNSAPWNVYGAVIKKEDTVIYDLAQQMAAGKLASGRQGFGLAQGTVDFITSQAVPTDVSDKITALKAQIIAGNIKPYAINVPNEMVIRIKLDPPATPGTNQPGTGTKQPSSGTKQPGAGTKQPGTGTKQPGTGTKQPGAGSNQPGTGSNQPGTGTEQPGTGTNQPGAGTNQPGTGTNQPGAGTNQPGTGTNQPGTGAEQSGTGTNLPGNGTVQPGTGTDQSGTGTGQQ